MKVNGKVPPVTFAVMFVGYPRSTAVGENAMEFTVGSSRTWSEMFVDALSPVPSLAEASTSKSPNWEGVHESVVALADRQPLGRFQ